MIKVGDTVAMPLGLDELEAEVIEVYVSNGRERLVLEIIERIFGHGDQRVAVPTDLVQLLPCKPAGLWLDKARTFPRSASEERSS